jgi:hypothetical protein
MILLKEGEYQLERVAVAKHMLVVKARPGSGQATASQVRYRGGWLIKKNRLYEGTNPSVH